MKLEEAIEILQHETYLDPNLESPDVFRALVLAIEALKYHLYRRSTVDAVGAPLLPNETKE